MATLFLPSAAAAARRPGGSTLLSLSAAALPRSWASTFPLRCSRAAGVPAAAPSSSISRCRYPPRHCLPSSVRPAPTSVVGARAAVAAAARFSAAAATATGSRSVTEAGACRAAAGTKDGAAGAAEDEVGRHTFVRKVEKRFFSSGREGGSATATGGGGQEQQQQHESEQQGGGSHPTLEGRYAAALLRAAKQQNQLQAVYGEMANLKELLQQSDDFKRFVETPALSSPQKQTLLHQLSATYKLQPLTSNLLHTLLENRRLPLLARVADAFEVLYRKEMGEIRCLVSSAQPLTSQQQKDVVAALQKRAGPRAKLILEYVVNPQLLGGLVVRLGEQVLDFSVATRIDRLQAQLMTPL